MFVPTCIRGSILYVSYGSMRMRIQMSRLNTSTNLNTYIGLKVSGTSSIFFFFFFIKSDQISQISHHLTGETRTITVTIYLSENRWCLRDITNLRIDIYTLYICMGTVTHSHGYYHIQDIQYWSEVWQISHDDRKFVVRNSKALNCKLQATTFKIV